MTYPGQLRKFRRRKGLVLVSSRGTARGLQFNVQIPRFARDDIKYDTHEPARGFHRGPAVKKTLPILPYFLFSSTIS